MPMYPDIYRPQREGSLGNTDWSAQRRDKSPDDGSAPSQSPPSLPQPDTICTLRRRHRRSRSAMAYEAPSHCAWAPL